MWLPQSLRLPAVLLTGTILLTTFLPRAAIAGEGHFKIQVVDDQTGRGVPLVELETVNNIRYVTDSQGVVAVDDPDLLDQRVHFSIRSHGYEFPKDGFGYAGKALDVQAGGSATLKIRRINIAQRLYRMTGSGIYRDSVLLGEDVPITHPLLNAKVFGSDSVLNTVYRGEIHWFWGDTNQPRYPLGNFHAPGATSQLPSAGGLDPDVGVDLTYFTAPDGFAKEVAKMPGDGPTWLDGLVVLEQDGQERMFAAYAKIAPPLDVHARGLARWDDAAERFEKVAVFDLTAPAHPGGHPVKHGQGDNAYVYFARPYPLVRVPAVPQMLSQLESYESFTCLVEGSRLDEPKLDRDAQGRLRYSWKRNTPAIDWQTQQKLIDAGQITVNEGLLALRDRDSGKPIQAHGGSVYWNEYRQRWVMVFLEIFGSSSLLGEVWYAEADSLVGPWTHAIKIATHDRYDFYNPKQHPMLDSDSGRTIYFEGTYTNTFSGHPIKTPRYNYNQIMYKLDLGDPRLALPVPIHRTPQGQLGDMKRVKVQPGQRAAFDALDRPTSNATPIYASDDGSRLTTTAPPDSEQASPAFYVLSADAADVPAASQPLIEFVHSETGERYYATEAEKPDDAQWRALQTLGHVWPTPLRCVWEAE